MSAGVSVPLGDGEGSVRRGPSVTGSTLGSIKREVYSLAVRLGVKLESAVLLSALVGALKKLEEMGDKAYAVLMDGMRLARGFSEAAVPGG